MFLFRRNQVEERKRLICEAERERREAILRKNQEREARIEAKRKNERSHIVFAFGSSTPRMLEPADTGGSTFWGTRRATSTTNVMMFSAAQPLTRRSSERELDGSKKRATSAGGLDRKPGEGESTYISPNIYRIEFTKVHQTATENDRWWACNLYTYKLYTWHMEIRLTLSARDVRLAACRLIVPFCENNSRERNSPLYSDRIWSIMNDDLSSHFTFQFISIIF